MTILSNLCACLLPLDHLSRLYVLWILQRFFVPFGLSISSQSSTFSKDVTPQCLTPFIHSHKVSILSFQLCIRLPSILVPSSLVSTLVSRKEKHPGRSCGANI